jgi:hypothetical protein
VTVECIHNAGFLSVGIFLVLLLDRLHELIHLTDLLICIQLAHVKRSFRPFDLPLILSILPLSILSPFHESPWRV